MDAFAEYLETISDQKHRTQVKEVLEWVVRRFPQLAPRIAWKQPMFTDHGTYIIGFSVSKTHMAASPEGHVIEKFADEIAKAGYSYSKMLIRFPWDKPVDHSLLQKLIEFNIEDKADCTTFWRK